MKRILFLAVSVCLTLLSVAQKTKPYPWQWNATPYEFDKVSIKSIMQIPRDTTATDSGSLGSKNGIPYLKFGNWHRISLSSESEVDVFLVAGQSNARGVGDSSLSPNPVPGTVYQYDNSVFEQVTNEVGNLPSGRGSMWPTFGINYYRLTGRKICFVPEAVDGSGQMVLTDAGFGNWGPSGTLFQTSVNEVTAAFWGQGENDARKINDATITPTQYQDTLTSMIARYRTIYGSNMPFYIFQTGTETSVSDVGYAGVRGAQQTVVDVNPLFNKMVSTNAIDFPDRSLMQPDHIHINQTGLNEQGTVGSENVADGLDLQWQRSGTALSYKKGRVGIGIKLPLYPFHVVTTTGDLGKFYGDGNGIARFWLENHNSGSSAGAGIGFSNDNGFGAQISYGSSTNSFIPNALLMHPFIGDFWIGANAGNLIYFMGASGPQPANIKSILLQNGAFGLGSTPVASAILDIGSTTRGVLFPRMTTAQMSAISSPATGLIIGNTDSSGALMQYNGSGWVRVSGTGGGGGGGGSGTVNSGTQYRLAYYASTGTAVSEAAAITANRALISDANGVPTHATTTATEIGYVNGVTSAIQTQLNGKQATGNYVTALTGDVTASGPGSATATIANDVVTYAKLQNVTATNRFIGRITSGAGDAEELTGTQATTLLDPFTSLLKGVVPASGGGTSNFLRADGTFAAPNPDLTAVSSAQIPFSNGTSLIGSAGLRYTDTHLDIGSTGVGSGEVVLHGNTSGALSIICGASTSTYTITLPTAVPGTSGMSLNATTGGVASWNWAKIADGDYGDISVSSTGSVFTIDNGVVTLAKMADMATDSWIGRTTAGTGAPEVKTTSQLKTALAVNLVDNTSDATKNSATATLTNKTIDGNSNTLTVLAASQLSGIASGTNGGTGVNNGSKTITVSGNTSIGSSTHTVSMATSGNTSITLPASGTVSTLAGSETLTNKTIAYGNNTVTGLPGEWVIACSDETTTITTGTAKVTFRVPYSVTVTAVRASVNTVSSSGIPTVDINEGGTTILSTKLTIDASEKTSVTAAAAAVISDNQLADDAEITIDFDVAGTGAKGMKVIIYYTRN
jgi:hypothetical protein